MTVLICGDSFTEIGGNNGTNTVWSQRLQSTLGVPVFNHARGGTGYVEKSAGYPARFTRQLLANSDLEPENIEVVILFGSPNDKAWAGTTEYRMLVWETHRIAREVYPNATLMVIGPQWSGPLDCPPQINQMRLDIHEAMWGYDWERHHPYVDPNAGKDITKWWFPPNRPEFWQGDKFHPNQLGQDRMFEKILPLVKNVLA